MPGDRGYALTDPLRGAHGHQTASGETGFPSRSARGMTYSALNERDTDRRSGEHGLPFRVIRSLRHTLAALLIVGAATAAFAAGTAAAAGSAVKSKPPCWKVLINDWYDGRIDGIYEIHCYRDALQHLPADVDTYSSARDDIRQALQKRITQGHSGGNGTNGGTSGGAGGGTSGGASAEAPRAEAPRARATPAMVRRIGERPDRVGVRRHEAGEGRLAAGPAARPRRRRGRPDGGRRSGFPDAQDAHAARAARLRRVRPAPARAGADRAVVAERNHLQIG